MKNIILTNITEVISTEEFGEDFLYELSFSVDSSFQEAESHAAECVMLCTYAPGEDEGREGDIPYIAVLRDDYVYHAVESYKKTRKIPEAKELTPLSGRFLFKAKIDYYGDLMYFYGFDSCDGIGENHGLCLIYPKEYAGTENEKILMRLLDKTADSYKEEKFDGNFNPVPLSNHYSDSTPAITDNAPKTTLLENIITAARTLRKLRLFTRLVALVAIILFLIISKFAGIFSTHHLVQLNKTEEIISDFTAEEQTDILDAFDVIIPEDEKNAHMASFMRKNISDKAASYVIEIEGVKDYDAFFAANSDCTLGKSVNETDSRINTKKTKNKYYITYNMLITDNSKTQNNKISEAYIKIEELFNSLSAK